MSFILYKNPEDERLFYAELKATDTEKNGRNFIFHSFDNQTEWIFEISNEKNISKNEILSLKVDLQTENQPNYILSQAEYLDLCQNFIAELKAKNYEKLILSRVKKTPALSPTETFLKLTQKYPKAFVYLFQHEGTTWLGATPEQLVKIENNKLQTIALAGTKANAENRDWTEKEREEHQFVVDYIASALRDFKPENGKTFTIELQNISHLKTNISATLPENFNTTQITEQLHPTPAVCGLPKAKSMAFILQNEPHERRFYAGFLGFKNANSADFYVNLRCAELFKDYTLRYVGGGLTAKSDAQSEWQETELKSLAIGE
ncbi:chorismate-binding protein [Ornithobacterium rhinotracheale]|uniref:chorismate-binding protein n=1 Tax=Ornithobacterium rhinotracheale TaxID=28251 RepID=UPI0040362375